MAKNNNEETEQISVDPVEEEIEDTGLPEAPQPPNDNPYWPKIVHQEFKNISIASDAYPSGRFDIHYPKKGEEIKIRGHVRKLSAEMGVSPDDLDPWSQNNFYVTALLKYACDNEEEIDWMSIEGENRKAEDALEATVPMIINWRFLFDDSEKK